MRLPHQARDKRVFMSQYTDGSQFWWIAETMWPTRSGCLEQVSGIGIGLCLRYRTDGLVAIGMGSLIHAEAEQGLRVALQAIEGDTVKAQQFRAAIRDRGARVRITITADN